MSTPNGPLTIPGQQADQTSAGRGRQERRLDPVLFDRLSVLVADDDGLFNANAPLGVELLEQCEGLYARGHGRTRTR